MSQIFDALQRSEAENSGMDLSVLKEPTAILERAERRAASDWESAVQQGGMGSLAAVLPADFATELRATPAAEPPRPPAATQRTVSETEALSVLEYQPATQGVQDPGQFQSVTIPDSPTSLLVSHTDRQGSAAEAFRLLGVRLRHLRRDRPLKKLLITSTIPQEGKSMVSANLACTLALTTRQKTLLIEGDVRRPSYSKIFGMGKKQGLCDWLRGDRNLTGCIYHIEGPDFCILPAGSVSANPLELLQSGRLPTLLDQLAIWFDWIIIDSPPVLPLADTSVWSRVADGILLVARPGTTKKKQLLRGIEGIERKKLIGALLNSSQNAGESDYYYRPSEAPKSATGTDN